MNFNVNGVKLGVQSYAIREYNTIETAVEALKELNLDTIELCAVQVNFDDPADSARVIEYCKKNNVKISSIGIEGMSAKNRAGAVARFEFVKNADCGYIGIDPDDDQETVDMIEELCAEYGVKVILHNHGRHHRYGSYEQIDNLISKFSNNLGIHMDCAWALDSGLDPVEMVKKYSDRIYGVHLKDFAMKDDGSHDEMILGDGDLKLPELMEELEKLPNFGVMSIEYEAPNPIANLKKCIRNVVGQVTVNKLK